LHVTWSINHPHQHWMKRLHMRHELVRNPLSHINVFDCEAYVHISKENKSNLDRKDENCIFMGYNDGLKWYNFWNPETKKVVYS